MRPGYAMENLSLKLSKDSQTQRHTHPLTHTHSVYVSVCRAAGGAVSTDWHGRGIIMWGGGARLVNGCLQDWRVLLRTNLSLSAFYAFSLA